ncbi:MAG: nuclear transport factor 2 family protein [Betaproteobacteria bacterium]
MPHVPTIADLEKLIDRYCAAWSERDAVRRAAMLVEVLSEGATYTDPRARATDVDALVAHIGRMQEARPGARVLRISAVDIHHDLARFGWCVELADQTRLPEGVDFIEIGRDGRIARIVGFFGPLTAATKA